MDPNELYDILYKEALGMKGVFNVVDLSRKILELGKRVKSEIINVNNTIYILMVIHAVRNNISINPLQPVLDGRSFDSDRGAIYTINSGCQLDEILLKILYLYVSSITT